MLILFFMLASFGFSAHATKKVHGKTCTCGLPISHALPHQQKRRSKRIAQMRSLAKRPNLFIRTDAPEVQNPLPGNNIAIPRGAIAPSAASYAKLTDQEKFMLYTLRLNPEHDIDLYSGWQQARELRAQQMARETQENPAILNDAKTLNRWNKKERELNRIIENSKASDASQELVPQHPSISPIARLLASLIPKISALSKYI